MDEDFNTPNLISYLLELVKELNTNLRQKKDYIEIINKIYTITKILGLKYNYDKLDEDNINLYKEWLLKRSNKDFESADRIRQELISKGIL